MSLRTAIRRVRAFRPNGQPLAVREQLPPPPQPTIEPHAGTASVQIAGQPAAGGYYAEPHRSRFPQGVRLAALAALVLFALQGFIGQVVRLSGAFAEEAPPAVTAPAVDEAAARQLAVAYTSDYFSYDAANPDVRATAISRWTGLTAGSDATWSGTGQLHTDIVTAGESVEVDDDRLIVQTTARVTPATLPDGASLPSAASALEVGGAADPGPAASPWQAEAPVWLSLNVAVARDDDGLRVAGSTLAGDPPAALERRSAEVDASTTSDTSDFASDVFTAYAGAAAGPLTYITTPDVHLAGLGGLVELAGLTGWQLAPAGDDGFRYATATVTWQLAGTGLQIPQAYALRVTETDGRWLVAAIGTHQED